MLRTLLISKKYVGFDLDDTLHFYSKTESNVTRALLYFIAFSKARGIATYKQLSESYFSILCEMGARSFVEGRTADDHRKERFEALLNKHNVPYDIEYMNGLLESYENILKYTTKLKPGALQVLQAIRRQSTRLVIITEGPQDAQQRTVERLAIEPYFDRIFTAAEFGKSKTDGLYSEVLSCLKIDPDQFIYIGDNFARDIKPAKDLGILTIYFDERIDKQLKDCTIDDLQTNSLSDIAQSLE